MQGPASEPFSARMLLLSEVSTLSVGLEDRGLAQTTTQRLQCPLIKEYTLKLYLDP